MSKRDPMTLPGLWWHCLTRTLRRPSEDHRMEHVTLTDGSVAHCCTCGAGWGACDIRIAAAERPRCVCGHRADQHGGYGPICAVESCECRAYNTKPERNHP